MRHWFAVLPLLSLAACGGASGPESVGSIAPPAGNSGGSGGGVTPAPTPTPTPPATGGTGGGVTPTNPATPTPTPTPGHFLSLSTAKSFDAIGGFQSLQVDEATNAVLYQGNASTVRAPSGQVTYDPRDGTFTINFVDTKAGVNVANMRYQDPVHRTEPVGLAGPEYGVPALEGFNYLQAVGGSSSADVSDRVTFFYQRPGSSTYYVSLGGYVHNIFTNPDLESAATSTSTYERGAFVFGDQTLRSQIPVSGTGTYTGGMIASMITGNENFQWIGSGRSELTFDFSKSTMAILLTGRLDAASTKGIPINDATLLFPSGSEFRATGSGTIDLVRTGGFTGGFDSVTFTNGTTQTVVYDRVNPDTNIAGANSIDGAFFGPNAVNAGGNFRIIGGVPNQRVDILGAFTGAKQ